MQNAARLRGHPPAGAHSLSSCSTEPACGSVGGSSGLPDHAGEQRLGYRWCSQMVWAARSKRFLPGTATGKGLHKPDTSPPSDLQSFLGTARMVLRKHGVPRKAGWYQKRTYAGASASHMLLSPIQALSIPAGVVETNQVYPSPGDCSESLQECRSADSSVADLQGSTHCQTEITIRSTAPNRPEWIERWNCYLLNLGSSFG